MSRLLELDLLVNHFKTALKMQYTETYNHFKHGLNLQ